MLNRFGWPRLDLGSSASASAGPPLPIRRWIWAVAAALALIYVAFANHLPVALLADASHDDGWFYDRALALLAGHWFGHFSQMTLIKGPGYPLFVAGNALLGLPLSLTQALLYVAGCGLMGLAVARLGRSGLLGLAVFALTLWHPAVLPNRMVRDDIYSAQTLLYIGGLVHLLFLARAPRARLGWALFTGAVGAWLWMTREEGVWILPASLVLCAAGLWRDRGRLRHVLAAAGTGWAVILLFCTLNLVAYGAFLTVDIKTRSYSRAIDALQSVRVGEPVAYAPVPEKVRQAVYAVSPSFAALRPFFDRYGVAWKEPGCGVYPSTCGDYAGGWFIWAFRDAVAWAGHYGKPGDAARFYDQISAEVRAACADGRLRCVRSPIPLMPATTADQWRQLGPKTARLGRIMLLREQRSGAADSRGPRYRLEAMWRFEGLPPRTDSIADRVRSLTGWYYGQGGWIELRCTEAGQVRIEPIGRQSSPDLTGFFHDPAAKDRRFSIDLPASGDCVIEPQGAAPGAPTFSFDQLAAQRDNTLAGGKLFLDLVAGNHVSPLPGRIVQGLNRIYGVILPAAAALAALALIAYLVQLARRRARPDAFAVATLALWLFLVTRLAILLLIDISAFPAIDFLYVGPAFPLSCAALLLTLFLPFRKTA